MSQAEALVSTHGDTKRRSRGKPAGGKVYDGLRQQILSGELEIGAWLVETQIAEEYGVSRTPVREALRRLIDDHLVAHDPYRGAVVRGVSAREAAEIGQIHEIHDGLAARLAASRADASAILQLQEQMARMRECIEGRDWHGAATANAAFHGLIYDIAGNERLKSVSRELALSMRRFSAGALADPNRGAQVLAEHEECVRAIEQSDPDAAERAARNHGRACMAWTDSWLSARPIAD